MILVVGGTGHVGAELLRELGTTRELRVLTRSAAKAAAWAKQGAQVVEGDLAKPDTLGPALSGVDRVFLLTDDHAGTESLQANLVAAAKAAKVKRLVKVSGVLADPASPSRVLAVHGRVERLIEQSGLAFTHVRSQYWMQNLYGSLGVIAATGNLFGCLQATAVAMVDLRDVAAVAARALTEDGHEGMTYLVTGPEALTYAQMAAKLGAALDRPIHYVDVPPAAAVQGMAGAGLPPWLAEAIAEIEVLFVQRPREAGEVTKVVQKVAGRAPRTFDAFAQEFKYAAAAAAAAPAPAKS